MAKNPDERFSTMLEFRDALEAACNYCAESGLPPPVVRKPGQTGYRLPEMRTTTSKAAAVSASGKSAAPTPTAASPLTTLNNPPVAVPDVVHHPEAVGYNMYLTWTMTGLLVAACILFVFNETSRPKPYVKRNPYHTITRSIPIAPVPPPVTQVPGASGAKPAAAKVAPHTAAVSTAPVRARRHKELAERSAWGTEKEREREHHVAVKKTPKTSPNSSVPPVDQSKFDMLRRLKSAPLKNEGSE
jgi:hypothetical protein